MVNNALKKIVSIKTENILFILYVFYMIINISKASLFIIAVAIHIIILTGVYSITYIIRQDIKKYVYSMDQIKLIDFKAIKKEIFIKVFNNNRPRLKLNVKPFLNNS